MPVLFIGHGSPMHAIERSPISAKWQEVGASLPKDAQAVVVVSAHWETAGTQISSATNLETIHDFYGFPPELSTFTYNATGSPAVAKYIQSILAPHGATLDTRHGLDHGAWVILHHLIPTPKIPILQISLDARASLPQVVEMFSILKHLRDQGVIFIGSGNIVHNLPLMQSKDNILPWAKDFDTIIANHILHHHIDRLTDSKSLGRSYELSVPTDEHYRPMLAICALKDPNESVTFFNETLEYGTISMRSFMTSVSPSLS